MNITEELNRLKQDVDGEGRWSAMDLFRFLGLSDWEKFKRIIRASKYVISTSTSTPITLIKNKGVEDYVLNAQAAFELIMKIVNDGYEHDRGWRAQNYFVQYMYEHDISQKISEGRKLIEKTFASLVSKHLILVKKSTELKQLSDWFSPKLIAVLDKHNGGDFLSELDIILSTYLDAVNLNRARFGFTEEAIKRLSHELKTNFSALVSYVTDEKIKMEALQR